MQGATGPVCKIKSRRKNMAFSFNRSTVLYIILLFTPFINIMNHNLSSIPIAIILGALLFLSLAGLKKVNKFKEHYFFITIILYAFFIYFLVALSLREGTFRIILFFTAPAFLYLYYSYVFDLKYFIRKYYQQLLKYYIIIIFLSIALDSVFIHVIKDVNLQLMSQEKLLYRMRPFGITGNATVNSVLIVFFYSLLLSIKANNKGFYFGLISISVLLQGSGLGFLVYGALFFSIARRKKNGNLIAVVGAFLILLLYLFVPITGKLSLLYILGMFNEFFNQYSKFISHIGNASDFMFGNVSGGIDFLPIFLTSNMGILYLLLIVCLFVYLILKTKSYYETVALYLMIMGSLHYPVLFYTFSAFFFPVFIFKIINYKALDL